MNKKQPGAVAAQSEQLARKTQGHKAFKNQNPNQNHNTKKESLGPNTNQ